MMRPGARIRELIQATVRNETNQPEFRHPQQALLPSSRLICAGILALVSLTVWIGCSVEKHYKTLSFFFDGVPDPNDPGRSGAWAGGVAGAAVIPHHPYVNGTCMECHTSLSNLSIDRNDASSCMRCHEEVTDQHVRMHGPVVGRACLWCHHPHESPHAYLLRESPVDTCRQCHETGLEENAPEWHRPANRNCLDCHYGHGGGDDYFLRPDEEWKSAPEGAEQ